MKKQAVFRHSIDLLLIVAGSTIVALSYNLFLIPHKVVPGGVGGLSMILNHWLGTPVGLMSVGPSVPLFAIAVKLLGKSYGAKSLLGMLITSLLIDFFTYLVPLRPATDNTILACIFGGIVLGAGLGLVFRGGGSTGGSDIIGMLLARYSNLSTGSAILLVDFMVISLAGAAYGNFELSLYGYLNLYLQTRAIDLVLEGVSYTRAMFVVSDRSAAIAHAINQRLGRGATLLHGTGAYTESRKDVVFTVLSKKEVTRVRDLTRAIDPEAFVIITDVYEVLGEGFHPRTEFLATGPGDGQGIESGAGADPVV